MFFTDIMHCKHSGANSFLSPQHISVRHISDMMVIGYSCSTVPLKSVWCAFHIVQTYAHTFISLISDPHKEDTKDFDKVKRCSPLLCHKLHIMHAEHQDGSAPVHYSDVPDQSGSIVRNALHRNRRKCWERKREAGTNGGGFHHITDSSSLVCFQLSSDTIALGVADLLAQATQFTLAGSKWGCSRQ